MIEVDETHALISADKVDGTAVYGIDGEKMGAVETLMISKRGGQVTNAVISVGGFLGIGEKYHSVPWEKLDYDEELDGYRLDVTEEQLRQAPTFELSDPTGAFSRENEERIYSYYGVAPYWM